MPDGIERRAGHRFFLPCSGGVASSRSLESAGSRGKMRQPFLRMKKRGREASQCNRQNVDSGMFEVRSSLWEKLLRSKCELCEMKTVL
jgi:hypothetical protein